jgi:hypothetical protein
MEGGAMFGEHLGGVGHVTASNKEMAYLRPPHQQE